MGQNMTFLRVFQMIMKKVSSLKSVLVVNDKLNRILPDFSVKQSKRDFC
jgi:hypothetical protein